MFALGLVFALWRPLLPNVCAQSEFARELQRRAEAGEVEAQFDLAVLYSEGEGLPKSYAESGKWFKKAAEAGLPEAQFNLALRYEAFGDTDAKHYAEAARWYRRAANQGLPQAQLRLAVLCRDGRGVPKDFAEAYKWSNLAASRGSSLAGRYRDALGELMSVQQILEGQRRADGFAPKLEYVSKASGETNGARMRIGLARGSGSGFVISEDGYLVTNAHVVEDALRITVRIGKANYLATVVTNDVLNDLAVLKVEGTHREGKFQPLPLGDSASVKLGQSVFTIGFPNLEVQGMEPKLTRGDINSLSGMRDDPRYFQVSLPTQPGNSGGPLLDGAGAVIGVVTMRLGDLAMLTQSGALPQNVNYAVKGELLRSVLARVPALAGKLVSPVKGERKFEDVVSGTQASAVLVLVY
jgi:S1-C subfamily serine protease